MADSPQSYSRSDRSWQGESFDPPNRVGAALVAALAS